jgi:putative two-component system response regulator
MPGRPPSWVWPSWPNTGTRAPAPTWSGSGSTRGCWQPRWPGAPPGGIDRRYIDDIYQSSILHDIGKVGIPDAVLLKPGELTAQEFEVIKCHTRFGGDALAAIEAQIEGRSFLQLGKEIAYHHHEKWDGSGYPGGLKGREIPLAARIVAVADVYDALTSKRFYKEAFSHEKARQIISELGGSHFDPEVVDAFLSLETKFDRIREEGLRQESRLPSSSGACRPGGKFAAAAF